LFITGRLKELINRGGEKISPLEVRAAVLSGSNGLQVDSVLLMHPNIAEAISFGVSDPIYGQEVHAVGDTSHTLLIHF
jgi:acyl-CoA synthetase (AMP-forming)/AMP-acid ligase II